MSDQLECPNCLTKYFSEFTVKPNDKRTFQGKCKKCSTSLKFRMNNYNQSGLLVRDSISFHINGIKYTVENQFSFTTSLNDYLRNSLNMTGTKITCAEGGCSACLVNVEVFDYVSQSLKNMAINSCLYPLYSCDGLKFTTIEGVGSKSIGFNEIQKRIVDHNGTQCGWCTPGMVMNMYSLLLDNAKPSKKQIENSFDGNICRCTGYRSILDAMGSFAGDQKPIDIEELNKLKCLNNCKHSSNEINRHKDVHIINDSLGEWYAPKDLTTLLGLLSTNSKYRIVSGNTGIGVYKHDGPYQTYIDPKNVADLFNVTVSETQIEIGSQITLRRLIEIFESNSTRGGFEYLSTLANHVRKIANVGVRNTATWAGNLVMKHDHLEFPSDVFLIFESVNAQIVLMSQNSPQPTAYSLVDFLNMDLNRMLIYSIRLQPFDSQQTRIKTFKVMPRSQNAHAYVNAGFRFEIDPQTYLVKSLPCIILGGVSKIFIHAQQTEKFLMGKNLNDKSVLKRSFEILFHELDVVDDEPVLATPRYRCSLALSLFYKFLLYVNQDTIDPRLRSALNSVIDERELSSGQLNLPSTDPSIYPVTKPMSKLNAALQASGEAQYSYDKIALRNQLEGAFILSTLAACRIDSIETSAALKMPGVVKILFAKDITGVNSFMPTPFLPEKLFADDFVDYAGQAIGLVVAESLEQAQNAANAVRITYKEEQRPILSVKDAIEAGSMFPKTIPDFKYGNAEDAIKNSPIAIDGEVLLDSQFPLYMENQNAFVEPTEDGFDVHCATQWLDVVQNSVAQLLGIKNSSSINVTVKQLGGAYGGKITRSNITATAAALASKLTNRPVRVMLDLNTDMQMIGKRFPWYAKYKVGFDKAGNIRGLIINWYCDCGNSPNENSVPIGIAVVDNIYNIKNWLVVSNLAKTNLPANTSVRSPGYFPAISIIESIIEHVSSHLKTDPMKIRAMNSYKKGDVTPTGQTLKYFNIDELTSQLLITSDYKNRMSQINEFNRNNRWKKKGLSMTPIKWGVDWGPYNCTVSVYSSDGSVSVNHGGVEMGQGIHTKVIQVCAYQLGIPMDTISIKNTDTFTNPNGPPSGGSITSELACLGVIECCKIINKRLEPIRKLMPHEKYTWPELISRARMMRVDLMAHYLVNTETAERFQYNVYGVAASEAIVDSLTGETQILRTDILYDGGQSLNGEIDMGQAIGAFVMGMGNWLYEKIRYDPNTGECLTNGTWEYKPPTTKDIPVDMRITFLQNRPNPSGILGSKCVGEPPLCLTPCVAFAVKRAIEAARQEISKEDFFALDSPATVERIQQLCLTNYHQFLF